MPLAQIAVPSSAAAAPAWAVHPFLLVQVTLGDGVFRRKRDLMLAYARSLPGRPRPGRLPRQRGPDTRGGDGLTFLDVLWGQALTPSPSRSVHWRSTRSSSPWNPTSYSFPRAFSKGR